MTILYYILWTLSLALKLSVLRWAEMLFYSPSNMTVSEILWTVVNGFRFDLMIVGFWLAPVVVFLVFSQLFTGRGLSHPKLAKTYLIISWIFICFLYLKDLISFPIVKNRLYWSDHLAHPFINFDHASQLEWWAWVAIVILIFGLFRIGIFRFQKFVTNLQYVSYFGVAFIFLWTVFISRGSLGQHHLRFKDCQFSENKRVQALCVNPIFTFSK